MAILADHATSSSYFLVVVIFIWVSVSAGPCDRFPCTSSLKLSLLLNAGCSVGVTVSCDEGGGEVGEDEVETRDNERFFAELTSRFRLIELTFGRMPMVTKVI